MQRPRVASLSLVLPLVWPLLAVGEAQAPSGKALRAEAEVTALTDSSVDGLVRYLATRYRRAIRDIGRYVSAARHAGKETDIDPLLLLAVMAVESSFDPAAESRFGAQGLMQVVPRFHREKIELHGGIAALGNPQVNVAVGARILRDYIAASGGLVEALQRYAGARSDVRNAYARRVLAERERLSRTIAAHRQAET